MKTILLTFDVEEFEYETNKNGQFEISKQGLLSISELLSKYNIKATFFTTTHFSKNNLRLIKQIHKNKHEIACHGYSHSDSYSKDLSRISLAKKEIEKIIKKKIKGFRAPRFEIKNISKLSEFGFSYDSSLHPTFIPRRYMNLFKKRAIHKIGNIVEISPSTLPIIRLPIFWLAFKNFPLIYSKSFTKLNSLFSSYTMLTFHSWEFANLSKINIPTYIKKRYGKELLNMLESYIIFCKKNNYIFLSISDYLKLSPKIP